MYHLFKGEKHNYLSKFWGVPQEDGTFIDVCLGPAGFLVSLLSGKEGPVKALETIDGPPTPSPDTVPWSVGTGCCWFPHPSSAWGGGVTVYLSGGVLPLEKLLK